MASKELTDELSEIVTSVGGSRRAELLIRSNRGASPSQSSIYKTTKGAGTDYVASCYISDLKKAISSTIGKVSVK